MSEMPFELQVNTALQEIEAGVKDAQADNPDIGEDDAYFEIANSITSMYPADVRREVKRRLGF